MLASTAVVDRNLACAEVGGCRGSDSAPRRIAGTWRVSFLIRAKRPHGTESTDGNGYFPDGDFRPVAPKVDQFPHAP